MLYIVPTPIGNLKDITLRALEALKASDIIFCEDTRQTQKLLNAYDIVGARSPRPGGETPPLLISLHEHSGAGRVVQAIRLLEEGKTVSLVSDGGTPLVSDPGFELVHEVIRKGLPMEVLPGPAAFVTALVASGLATDAFSFLGFLSQKSASRKKALEELKEREETLIFYESPYRVLRVLEEMKEVFGDREAAVGRELTKKFEETARGTLSQLIDKFSKKNPVGEFVILVSGKDRKKMFE